MRSGSVSSTGELTSRAEPHLCSTWFSSFAASYLLESYTERTRTGTPSKFKCLYSTAWPSSSTYLVCGHSLQLLRTSSKDLMKPVYYSRVFICSCSQSWCPTKTSDTTWDTASLESFSSTSQLICTSLSRNHWVPSGIYVEGSRSG